ncbi:MAG: MBL fold metallo-hydrolase, partial [Oscillospiraceae bacterium]
LYHFVTNIPTGLVSGVQVNNNNYFKLRDIASAFNFGVGWDGNTGTITIDTSVGYLSGTGNLTVHFLDVGQGDAEFIELPDGKTMLIDAGESEYGDTVVNYIKGLGYKKVDYLVATHPHADHIGGMTKVVQSFAIGAVYMPNTTTTTQTYSSLLTAIKSAGLTITAAKAGVNMFSANGLTADIIAPVGTSYDDLNNYSAVIKLSYKNNSFLFMGDAEELSENEITANVKADVLKVGHHGSNSSTGQDFLSKVAPKYAVISVGTGNDYGHPAQITLDKLSAIGAAIYRTDKDGTVIFKSDGTNITVNKSPSSVTSTGGNGGSSGIGTVITANVVISNVDKVAEIVTIKNNGTSDVELSGWELVSVTGNQRYTFPSYTLKAGATVTIASGGASGSLTWTKSNVWNNSSSDPAQLYDAGGKLISSYTC